MTAEKLRTDSPRHADKIKHVQRLPANNESSAIGISNEQH
jgi:hypothetical protein